MSHAVFPPFAEAPTQRNRRLLLTLPACALPMLSACGGGCDLSYDTEQALYVVGEAITPNIPHVSGGSPHVPANTPVTFSVKPALPPGLTLNPSTGVISGIPIKLRRQATHTVTATASTRDVRGAAETQLRITVTGRGAWSPVATVPGARQAASIAPLPGGKFLVAGGRVNSDLTNSVEIYDSSSGTWSSAAPMLAARERPSVVLLRNGRVLVLAGDSRIPVSSADNPEYGAAELYHPDLNAWTATGRMNEPRNSPTAHLLASGKVLVVGGFDNTATPITYRNTAELYDPDTGVWTLLPTRLSAPRSGHAAALLPDGKTLLVAGGIDVTTAELYKVDGSATKVIPYGVNGHNHEAVKLDDGSVLVASDGSSQSRRFNPATSSWSTSAMVSGSRVFPTLTLLADGRVLMSGGYLVAGGLELKSAEIYNPDVNRWTAATPMTAARQDAMATLLGDGSVLVVSGYANGAAVDASERYLP